MDASAWDIMMGKFGKDGPSIFDYGNDAMAMVERMITKKIGIDETLDWASQDRGYQGDSRGKGDAMRHLLLSAELQRVHPMLAGPLLYGHEYVTNVLQGQRRDDRDQDLHNNRLGREIGRKAKNRDEIERMARETLESGRAMVLSPLEFDRDAY